MEVRIGLDANLRLAGRLRRNHGQSRNELLRQKILAKPTVGILLPTRQTAHSYARLFVQLRRAGAPIPDNDLWIAGLTLEHDLRLITRDRHFERIPQLLRS